MNKHETKGQTQLWVALDSNNKKNHKKLRKNQKINNWSDNSIRMNVLYMLGWCRPFGPDGFPASRWFADDLQRHREKLHHPSRCWTDSTKPSRLKIITIILQSLSWTLQYITKKMNIDWKKRIIPWFLPYQFLYICFSLHLSLSNTRYRINGQSSNRYLFMQWAIQLAKSMPCHQQMILYFLQC